MKKLGLFFAMLFFNIQTWASLPYYPIQFPRDDAAHYENVPYPVDMLSEWWYYNGRLISATGREFGYYLTYAYMRMNIHGRIVIVPRIELQITDIKNQKVYGNSGFFSFQNSNISTKDLYIALGKNFTLQKNNNSFIGNGLLKSKDGTQLEYSLEWIPTREALLASGSGLIDMTEKTNSYYYSYSNLTTKGYIKIGNEKFELDPQQSISWMDHQWGDFVILPWTEWVWASVQLENGISFDLAKSVNNQTPTARFINIIMPDNSRLYLKDFEYIIHPVPDGQKHPLVYELSVPAIHLNLKLTASSPNQDINEVWEGLCVAEGTYNGVPVKGQANTEKMGAH